MNKYGGVSFIMTGSYDLRIFIKVESKECKESTLLFSLFGIQIVYIEEGNASRDVLLKIHFIFDMSIFDNL